MLGKTVTPRDLSVAERAFAASHNTPISKHVYLAPIRNGLRATFADGSKRSPRNYGVARETRAPGAAFLTREQPRVATVQSSAIVVLPWAKFAFRGRKHLSQRGEGAPHRSSGPRGEGGNWKAASVFCTQLACSPRGVKVNTILILRMRTRSGMTFHTGNAIYCESRSQKWGDAVTPPRRQRFVPLSGCPAGTTDAAGNGDCSRSPQLLLEPSPVAENGPQ